MSNCFQFLFSFFCTSVQYLVLNLLSVFAICVCLNLLNALHFTLKQGCKLIFVFFFLYPIRKSMWQYFWPCLIFPFVDRYVSYLQIYILLRCTQFTHTHTFVIKKKPMNFCLAKCSFFLLSFRFVSLVCHSIVSISRVYITS